jgi:hypothetical protein
MAAARFDLPQKFAFWEITDERKPSVEKSFGRRSVAIEFARVRV